MKSRVFGLLAVLVLVLCIVVPASSGRAVGSDVANVAITGMPNPGTTGQVTYDVTVTPVTTGGPTPTGSVAVADGQGSLCAIVALDGTGAGSCSITENASGSPYTVTATYNGDINYASNTNNVTETVNPANQATLSVTSTSGTFGTALTLTTGGGSGTGAVTYAAVNGTASGCAVLSGQLTASSAGTCLVTATKAADANYNAASSAQTTVTLAAATQATLTLTSTSGTFGTPLTLSRERRFGHRRRDLRRGQRHGIGLYRLVGPAHLELGRHVPRHRHQGRRRQLQRRLLGPDHRHLGPGRPGDAERHLDVGHLRHPAPAHRERGFGHRRRDLRRGQRHGIGLRHLDGPAHLELGGHVSRHRHQGRRHQLQRRLLGPDHRHLGPGDPYHTDHHEPAHERDLTAGASRQSSSTNGDGTTSVTSNTPSRLLHQRPCGHLRRRRHVLPERPGGCGCQLSRELWRRPDHHDRAGRRDHADHHQHPVARQRVLRLHGHPGDDRRRHARRSPPARRRCAASAPTGSRSPLWASAPAR